MRFSLGASTGVLLPELVDVAVAELARRGVREIEAVVHTRGEYELAFCRRLQGHAQAHGARVVALHAYTSLHPVLDRYPRRREEGIALLDQLCVNAAGVGVPLVVWHGASQEDGRINRVSLADLLEVYVPLAARARACGVTLTLENVGWCLMRTPDDVHQARAAGARFTYDPFQALDCGQEPLAIVAAMGDAIAHVHASDYRPGVRHPQPGDGIIDWPAVLAAVAATGYRGPIINEAPEHGDPAAFERGQRCLLGTIAGLDAAAG
jgi:sugar phosphate isomerase/epimerase